MNRKSTLLLGALAIGLTGCGAVTSGSPGILVTLSQAPPAAVAMGAQAQVTATVSNDSAGMGVNWSCTPASSCGNFNPTSTASGTATTYTAPAAVPAGGIATIVATSKSDSTKSANGHVHITGIQVSFTTPPPTVVTEGSTAMPVATVTNDAANAGVSWSCAPAGACGSFNPTTTASGTATTYTAPNQGANVTIMAASVTDPAVSSSGAVAVPGVASNATLKGQYAFLIRAQVGNQTTRGNTTFIGSVTLDGAGNITGGEEEIIASLFQGDRADPIVPTVPAMIPNTSYYKVDANGHGIMRLMTQTFGETLDISFVVTSASHAEVIETGGDPGSGTFDLQTTSTGQTGGFNVSQISGSYAFTLDGVDSAAIPNPTHKVSIGGVFQADGMGNITGGTLDVNDTGTTTLGTTFTGVIASPDGNGRGRITISAFSFGKIFVFYIVNNKVLRLFEDDGIDFTGGSAYAQSSTAPPQSGNFVYQHSGWSSTGRTIGAGQFTADAGGSITAGVSSSNAGGAPTVPSSATTASGMYQPGAIPGTLTLADAAGAQTFHVYPVDPTLNILDPNNKSGGGGALLLHTDTKIVGSGVLLPQAVAASANIAGFHALNLENAIFSSSSREVALAGVFLSDGVSNFTNGAADYDADDTVNPTTSVMLKAPFTGTYLADATFAGHFVGTFNIPAPAGGYPFIIPSTNAFNVSIYQASSAQAFVAEMDTHANSIGRTIQQQLP